MQPGVQISPLVVALAIAVVRAKPPHLSLREYLSRAQSPLSARLSNKNDEVNDPDTAHRLQEKVAQLERQVKTCSAKLQLSDQHRQHLEATLRLATEGQLPVLLRDLLEHDRAVDSRVTQQQSSEQNDFQDKCHRLLYLLCRAESLQKGSKENAAMLSSCLIQLTYAIRILIDASMAANGEDAESLGHLAAATTACGRAISVVFRGMQVLEKLRAYNEPMQAVSQATIELYAHLLSVIRSQPLTGYDAEQPAVTARRMTRSHTRLDQYHHDKARAREITKQLTSFLKHCQYQIIPECQSHRLLFDQLLSTLLLHVGVVLFTNTFGHAKGKSVEDDIRAIQSSQPSPENNTRLEHTSSALLALLRHALTVEEQMRTRPASSRSDRSTNGNTALQRASHHIQRLVLHAIFKHSIDDQAVTNLPARPVPVDLDELTNTHLSPQEWFQQEVWRTIGWDILIAEDDLIC